MQFDIGPLFLAPTSMYFIGGVLLLALVYWALTPLKLRPHLLLLVSLAYAGLLTGWKLSIILAPILFTYWAARRFRNFSLAKPSEESEKTSCPVDTHGTPFQS